MTRLCFALFSALFCLLSANSTLALPSDALLQQINAKVLRVQVARANGNFGFGSAVVVAENQVITNCHVVADAQNIVVVNNGMPFSVSAIKPDWHYDLCILKVDDLHAPIAKIGSSKNLKYEQSVFTIGISIL